MPFPTVTPLQAAAIVDRFHLPVGSRSIRRLESSGNVHAVFQLGNRYLLKVPRDHFRAIAETCTASVAVPAATKAGIRTGALVGFDDSLEIISVPYTVLEYVEGRAVVASSTVAPSDEVIWTGVGRELATLHTSVGEVDDPNGWLEEWGRDLDYPGLLAGLVDAGVVADHLVSWFDELLATLRPAVERADRYRRFVHGDLKPGNVLQHQKQFQALIDWDDAGWFDPAIDFAQVPLHLVDVVLAGYRSVAPLDGDDTAEQRILWDHVMTALNELWRMRVDMDKKYQPSPSDGLVELLALAVDGSSPLLEHFPPRRRLPSLEGGSAAPRRRA
jgi:aminoglycoside phosphotransferase (APT) family kinase protein